jgi:hypothetical protein
MESRLFQRVITVYESLEQPGRVGLSGDLQVEFLLSSFHETPTLEFHTKPTLDFTPSLPWTSHQAYPGLHTKPTLEFHTKPTLDFTPSLPWSFTPSLPWTSHQAYPGVSHQAYPGVDGKNQASQQGYPRVVNFLKGKRTVYFLV